MSKRPNIYIAQRSGGRLSRADTERAIELFTSTGTIGADIGNEAVICEVLNHCLEKGIPFTLDTNRGSGPYVVFNAK